MIMNMKKILLAVGLSVLTTQSFAQYSECSPRFLENITLDFEESVQMMQSDMRDLAENYIEREMVYDIDHHELFKSNYVLYCTEMGKSNKIIYYMHGILDEQQN